jgi:hypothetical protein
MLTSLVDHCPRSGESMPYVVEITDKSYFILVRRKNDYRRKIKLVAGMI